MRGYEVIRCFEELAPLQLAEEWDNSGWQVGDPEETVRGIIFTLDLTPRVLLQARQQGANLINSHHPLIFKPISRVLLDRFPGSLIHQLIEQRLMLYTAHTSLDNAPQGISQALGNCLGLRVLRVLNGRPRRGLFKLVVFVPESHLMEVREAICRAGAGWIGRYSDCTFRTSGIGTFRPLEGANPFLGKPGVLEEAAEYRLETIVPQDRLEEVLQSMFHAHPYEEVAYDLYSLANRDLLSGPARIGVLPQKQTLGAMVETVSQSLRVSRIRLARPDADPAPLADKGGASPYPEAGSWAELPVERVAVCGGSGAEFIAAAAREGAELLVTGDLKYHEAQEARRLGLPVIAAGHAATEQPGLEAAAAWLGNRLGPALKITVNQHLEDEIIVL